MIVMMTTFNFHSYNYSSYHTKNFEKKNLRKFFFEKEDFSDFFFATGKPAGRPEFRYPVFYRTGRTGVKLQIYRTDRK